jgi:arabinan endo-1,5-alpha-L-arabinosidase
VFTAIPAWVIRAVPGVTNLWAPEIRLHDGMFYLYYAALTFGSNRSVIGLATNKTLDPTQWVDQGLVAQSQPTDDFNAIDPAVVEGKGGTPYLAFGSFFSGIRMWQLQWPSGKLAPGQGQPLRLAGVPWCCRSRAPCFVQAGNPSMTGCEVGSGVRHRVRTPPVRPTFD